MVTLSVEYYVLSLFGAALFGAFILQLMVGLALRRALRSSPTGQDQVSDYYSTTKPQRVVRNN